MRSFRIGVLAIAALGFLGVAEWSESLAGEKVRKDSQSAEQTAAVKPEEPPVRSSESAVRMGIDWLASVQGDNDGWGQDGGDTSYVRQGERLETNGNDVANSAVAALALAQAGHTPGEGKYRRNLEGAIHFILGHVERSPEEGLAVTDITGTQIQRKLGPYIDTFLTARLLAEIDGEMRDAETNARVRDALEKCVAKIERHQQEDGSWNLSGGWAPILGTSIASRSLFEAKDQIEVEPEVLAKVNDYTEKSAKAVGSGSGGGVGTGAGRGFGPGSGGGVGGGVYSTGGVVAGTIGGRPGYVSRPEDAGSAGVPLYRSAQIIEQLSRTEEDREKNADEIAAVTKSLGNARFVEGFGSMGGEEFFSYLNISDSLHRMGGADWEKWNSQIKTRLVRLQNDEGSWAGHHCITGRVAVTSAAILTLLADQQAMGRGSRELSQD